MSSERVKVGVSLDCTGAHYNLRLGDPYMAEGWGRGSDLALRSISKKSSNDAHERGARRS